MRHAEDFGIVIADPRLDMLKAQVYKRGVVDKNAKGIEFLFKKNKVEGLQGVGRLAGPHDGRDRPDATATKTAHARATS